MQALILSAGKGKRLRPMTNTLPKVMIDVFGKPLLEHHILLLKQYEVRDIFINLFYMPKKIIDHFDNGEKFGVNINYSHEYLKRSYLGPKLLGSAGALHNFKKELQDDFFVLYGDIFMKVNLKKMLAFHQQKKSLFTIAVHPSTHPKDSDLIKVNREMNIISWIKTPHKLSSGLSSAGLFIINSQVLEFLPKIVPYDFAHDFIPQLIKKIPLFAYNTHELMMDIGTIDRYNLLLDEYSIL